MLDQLDHVSSYSSMQPDLGYLRVVNQTFLLALYIISL